MKGTTLVVFYCCPRARWWRGSLTQSWAYIFGIPSRAVPKGGVSLEPWWPQYFLNGQVLPAEKIFALVDILFRRRVEPSTLFKKAGARMKSEDIDLFFRRQILDGLRILLSVAHTLAKAPVQQFPVVELGGGWPHLEFLEMFFMAWGSDVLLRQELRAALPDHLVNGIECIARGASFQKGNAWRHIGQRILPWGRAIASLVAVLRLWENRWERRDVLLRTYANDWGHGLQQTMAPVRDIDSFVNGSLTADRVAVWCEWAVTDARRKIFQGKGYRVISPLTVTFGPRAWCRRLAPALGQVFAWAPLLWREAPWWSRLMAEIIYTDVIWDQLARRCQPSIYVVYNELSAKGILRNIVLRRHTCRTVFLQHSSNQLFDEKGEWGVNPMYGYLIFDAVVTWGSRHSRFFNRHPGKRGEFWEVGCPWGELVENIRKDREFLAKTESLLFDGDKYFLGKFQRKIAVFDTGAWLRLPREEIVQFYEGIAWVAERNPTTLFLCKPKAHDVYAMIFGPDGDKGERLWHHLLSMPNVRFLPSEQEDIPVIALCDQVVSICFTSACLVAWSAGMKAVYFSPTGLFSDVFWNKVPGAMVVGFDALARWVTDPTKGDSPHLPEEDVDWKGLVPYRDGKSLSRLREHLLSSVSRFSKSSINKEKEV